MYPPGHFLVQFMSWGFAACRPWSRAWSFNGTGSWNFLEWSTPLGGKFRLISSLLNWSSDWLSSWLKKVNLIWFLLISLITFNSLPYLKCKTEQGKFSKFHRRRSILVQWTRKRIAWWWYQIIFATLKDLKDPRPKDWQLLKALWRSTRS